MICFYRLMSRLLSVEISSIASGQLGQYTPLEKENTLFSRLRCERRSYGVEAQSSGPII